MIRRYISGACLTLLCLLTASAVVAKEPSDSLSVGDTAPEFSVKDDQGKQWNSADHFGKKIVVLYFYPADMTGGCTAQACGYRDTLADLASQQVEVVGVSGDSVENHQWFKKAHELNFPLLADVDGEVAEKFGVPITRGSKSVKAIIDGSEQILKRDVTAKRWTFVIDRDGKIAYRDDKVKAKQDPAKILDVVKDLQ
ncbi:bacterioferritin comigratory protein [Rhodopirellula maiorica SM1]|uniref:thioredoxin-dependent peroxiredoxin n=1 Tax=Rhodopirellula maiorica SM1 TaxID=1265738 RepID=M5RLX8_9BACT|nr:peroxiredoxin [Rhodopirellula maiorica]EMI20211.1 bacterioferritin comigratory protein [Rhodopirellula maiorica SM1]